MEFLQNHIAVNLPKKKRELVTPVLSDEIIEYEAEEFLAITKSYGGCRYTRYQGIELWEGMTFADWLRLRKGELK